ncbi:MAG TPA: tryptophan 7-halogenase, partial [Verrucomicrobiae bacterium]|nr:tryptophan 7-halogenase [Verrucomicrobiae bacterium]
MNQNTARVYDVAVVGGALAGAATAFLLLRSDPRLKVLVLEKSTSFGRRVGEATVEISGYFLGRVLGLTQYLNEAHLVKQGMRFWFYNDQAESLEDCSEIGGRYLSRVPAYQIDRALLDAEVLRRAQDLGAEVWRPASVGKIELHSGGEQRLEVRYQDELRTVQARWVIDASGVAAVLARQQGWWRPNEEHPTAAVWARWTGVKDWDGLDLARKYPAWSDACHGIRATATNHFVGPGWWAWCIPLKGGDVSIGVTFDQRLVKWPETGPLGERLKTFLAQHPVARELMAEAKWREGDVHWRKNLPYCSTTFAGNGFAMVGDAGAFLDPFYSPGMDWISFTVSAACELVLAERRGDDLEVLLEEHNRDFGLSYQRWFQALYLDKYEYLGDFQLMRLAFLLDLGLYYLGVASQPFKYGQDALRKPVFSTPISRPFFRFMKSYNRRFAAIARARRRRGCWGKTNAKHRFMFQGYTLSPVSSWPILKAIGGWAWLELTEGWRSWWPRNLSPVSSPAASE